MVFAFGPRRAQYLNAAEHAGAIVVDTFKEFEQLLELAVAFHEKDVSGIRVAAVSNAGFETVGMADAIQASAIAWTWRL